MRRGLFAVALALTACGSDGPCERLQPTFMAQFERMMAETMAAGPGRQGGLGPAPDREAAQRRAQAPADRLPADTACSRLDKQLEAELYRGVE